MRQGGVRPRVGSDSWEAGSGRGLEAWGIALPSAGGGGGGEERSTCHLLLPIPRVAEEFSLGPPEFEGLWHSMG